MHYMGQLKLPAMLLRGCFFVIVYCAPYLSFLVPPVETGRRAIRQLFSRLYRGLTPQSWVPAHAFGKSLLGVFFLLSSCGYFILPIAPIGV